eukprot:1033996-Rhodomonas_salina.1
MHHDGARATDSAESSQDVQPSALAFRIPADIFCMPAIKPAAILISTVSVCLCRRPLPHLSSPTSANPRITHSPVCESPLPPLTSPALRYAS